MYDLHRNENCLKEVELLLQIETLAISLAVKNRGAEEYDMFTHSAQLLTLSLLLNILNNDLAALLKRKESHSTSSTSATTTINGPLR